MSRGDEAKMKKGEGLALNTIVLAAIALIVLLIVIAIITGTSNKVVPFFGKQSECKARGGTGTGCMTAAECDGAKIYGLKDCTEAKPVCCVKQ